MGMAAVSTLSMLQRGRAHVSAEMYSTFGVRPILILLQRGRAHVSAEIPFPFPLSTFPFPCFNGAALM